MSIFQGLAVCFALFMIYIVNYHRTRLRLNMVETSFWFCIWLTFITISLFPNLLQGLVGVFHFSRVFDLLLVLALMVITTIVVLSYFLQRENQRKIENYVRKTTLAVGKKKYLK